MPDDKKGAAAAPAADGGEGKKKSNLFLLIGIIAGIVAIQTAAVYFIVPKPPPSEEAIALKAAEDSLRLASEAATKMGAVTDPPIEATVNIAGTEDRFVKASIIFEYDEKNAELGAELVRRAPKYKDMLINHLGSLSFTEISDPSERDKIRKDLQRIVNASLPAKMGEVRDVIFQTYLIQ
jgi:flagellar basal body-associated protein FliL